MKIKMMKITKLTESNSLLCLTSEFQTELFHTRIQYVRFLWFVIHFLLFRYLEMIVHAMK